MTTKITNPWPERNKQPILEVLQRVLPTRGTILEIGSGSGQHADFFSNELSSMRWLPSDIDDDNLASIRAWRAENSRPNFLDPIRLDVLADPWPVDQVEAIFSANMIHITPWKCCLGLLAGARRHLVSGGLLILYGPFRIGGEHTAESNEAFDGSLRNRDPRFGVRDLEAVVEATEELSLEERVEMPANNQILVFERA